jgi:hypothetical protein
MPYGYPDEMTITTTIKKLFQPRTKPLIPCNHKFDQSVYALLTGITIACLTGMLFLSWTAESQSNVDANTGGERRRLTGPTRLEYD